MDNPQHKFDRFTDPTGERMATQDLKVAGWLAHHRVGVRRASIILFSVIAGGLFVYGVFGLMFYALFGLSQDNKMGYDMVQSTANYTAIKPKYQVSELRILDANVYEASVGRYDFVANIVNDNARWAAIISYKFTYGNGETEIKEAIILPKTERPVIIPGHKTEAYPGTTSFIIESVNWRHIDTHDIADAVAYMTERQKFSVTDMVFTAQSVSENIPSNILRFTLVNENTYSFWDVPLVVELFQNGTRVGIAQTKVEKLKAGEKRPLDLRTLTPNISVTDIKVHATVNIFDDRVFMAPEAS